MSIKERQKRGKTEKRQNECDGIHAMKRERENKLICKEREKETEEEMRAAAISILGGRRGQERSHR